jgi:hypothetical protein
MFFLEGVIFGVAIAICIRSKFNFTHLALIALAKLGITMFIMNMFNFRESVYLFATVGYSILFVYKYLVMPRLK